MADIQKLIEIVGDGTRFQAALDEAEQQAKAAQARLAQIGEAADKADATLKGRARERAFALFDQERKEVERQLALTVKTRERVEEQITSAAQKAARDRIKVAEHEASERGHFEMGTARGFARNAASEAGLNLPMLSGGFAGIAGSLAGVGISVLIKKAIDETVAWANAIRDLAIVAGGSAREVSTLAAVADRYGVSTDKLDTALRNLASAVELNPQQLQALGVATEDATGKTRPLIDIFNDVRRVLSGASGDTATMRVAQELFGRSVQDLIPMLRAGQGEIDDYAQSALEAGRVIDESAIAKAKEWELETAQLANVFTNAMHTIGGIAIPFAVNALQGLGQAFDTLGTLMAKMRSPGGGKIIGYREIVGDLGPEMVPIIEDAKNITDLLGEAMDEAQKRHDQQVTDMKRSAEEAANASLGKKGGTDLGGATLKALQDKRKGESDAIRQHIQDLQDEKRVEDDRRQNEIDGIKEGQKAEQERHDAALQAIADKREAALAAIQATIDAEKEADRAADLAEERRHINGQDTVSLLQARITELQRIASIEDEAQRKADAAAHLKDLEATAAHENAVMVFRTKGETEEQYNQKVFDQQQRSKAATKAVEDQKAAIAKDASKAALAAVIEGINSQIKAEERKSALEKLDLAETRRLRDEAHKDEIEKINTAAKKAKDAEDDKAKAYKKTTDFQITELERGLKEYNKNIDEQIRAAERLAAGINAAYSKIVTPPVPSGGVHNPVSGVDTSNPRNFADGGTIMLREPTALMGLRSGSVLATAALEGPEEASFGGVRGAGGGGDTTIHVPVYLDGQLITDIVTERQARGTGRRASFGYGRKRF